MINNPDKLPNTCIILPKAHTGPIYTIKYNTSGEYCMTGSEDRSVCLYNPSKNLMIKNYKNLHNYDVYSLDISNDNSKFITGGGDKNVILTDVI
jgi:mitogen-activated protein kinase organizer 1